MSRNSTIVLDREEWEAFISDVLRMVQSHMDLLRKVRNTGRETLPRDRPQAVEYGRSRPRVLPERMRCPSCGMLTKPQDRYCRACGRNMSPHVQDRARQQVRPLRL